MIFDKTPFVELKLLLPNMTLKLPSPGPIFDVGASKQVGTIICPVKGSFDFLWSSFPLKEPNLTLDFENFRTKYIGFVWGETDLRTVSMHRARPVYNPLPQVQSLPSFYFQAKR